MALPLGTKSVTIYGLVDGTTTDGQAEQSWFPS